MKENSLVNDINVSKRPKKDEQEALYWKMAQEQGLGKPFQEAGEELNPINAIELFKIRNRSIRRLYYFMLYCGQTRKLKKLSLSELTEIAMKLLHCSQRTAYDYAQCVFSVVTWLF
jgi:hypothetical protein